MTLPRRMMRRRWAHQRFRKIEQQLGQTDAKPESALQKKMPQKPQTTYGGYGMAAGMGGAQAASPPSPPKGAPGMSSGQVSETV